MSRPVRYFALVGLAAAGLTATACQPAAQDTADTAETKTVIETREVPVPSQPPVVIEAPTPPAVVVDRDRGDTTTVRAGRDGLEVETTNR